MSYYDLDERLAEGRRRYGTDTGTQYPRVELQNEIPPTSASNYHPMIQCAYCQTHTDDQLRCKNCGAPR